ncbi:MAG: TatD family hydrolase [Clostridia bacterium]|nr:TatD family hydrolase [Clostridia bacterium]
MEFFDSHSHLNDEKFDGDREAVINYLIKENITKFITCGYDLEGSKKAIEIANNCDFTYATVGISPNDIPQNEEELWKQLDEIKQLATNKKVVAIGEIGLDYYWNKDNKELQIKAFIKQIDIANELNLPIVIHTREAVMDTIQVLKEHPVTNKGVFHCCPLNRELVKEALKLDFYISFAGVVTFKNAKNADEIINMVPVDKFLIETDSPYLAPEPVRGTRNTPANVIFVAAKVASSRNISIEEIAKASYENACKLFKIF